MALHTHLVTLRRSCVAKTAQEVRPQDLRQKICGPFLQDVKEVYHLDSSSIVSSFRLAARLCDVLPRLVALRRYGLLTSPWRTEKDSQLVVIHHRSTRLCLLAMCLDLCPSLPPPSAIVPRRYVLRMYEYML